jgi:hypothetical protein
MKKKSLAKKNKKTNKKSKAVSKTPKDSVGDLSNDSEFGGVTVLKAGTSLAALLLSQSSNGMAVGPIY